MHVCACACVCARIHNTAITSHEQSPPTPLFTPRLSTSGLEEVEALSRYTCPEGYYNPGATLLFTSGEKTIEHLLSRNTHYQVCECIRVCVCVCVCVYVVLTYACEQS
jgi:hypothetical protein